MREKVKYYKIFWAVTIFWLGLDQLTKYGAQLLEMQSGGTLLMHILPWFNFVYVKNTGAAWGVMAGSGTILGILAVVALLAIYVLRRALQIKRVQMQIAFGLLVAGIAGNMIDRLFVGYVVDFVDCNFFGYAFPAFNVADVGITVGVAMYIILTSFESIFFKPRTAPAPEKS